MAIRDLMPWNARGSFMPGRDLTDSFENLHQQIGRVFQETWNSYPFNGISRGLALTDIAETERQIEVCVELPGFQENDIDVSIEGNILTITAETSEEQKADGKSYVYSERRRGSIERSIRLPEHAETEDATASFKDGVLTVCIPKSEKSLSNSRRIPLNNGSAAQNAKQDVLEQDRVGQNEEQQNTHEQNPPSQQQGSRQDLH